jgi:hypothetical protein
MWEKVTQFLPERTPFKLGTSTGGEISYIFVCAYDSGSFTQPNTFTAYLIHW